MDAGNDLLDGGSGTDWLYVTGSTKATVNLANTKAQNTGYGRDTIKELSISQEARGRQVYGFNW